MKEKIEAYQKLVQIGHMPSTYKYLLSVVMRMKAYMEKKDANYANFKFSNVSPGYMDFTYFPFYDEHLRGNLLRFGIVLNHAEMRFELWLMGQNADVQAKYWLLLKDSKWNIEREEMPIYSVLETVLVSSPDFENEKVLFESVATKAMADIIEIVTYLKKR